MNERLANMLGKIIKYTGILLLTLGVCGGIYVYTLITSAKEALEKSSAKKSPESLSFVIEEGSLVSSEDWLAFRSLGSFSDEENKETRRNKFVFSKDFSSEIILKTPCGRFNCFYSPVEFSALDSSVWKTLMGVEDYRFLEHQGVDPKAILRAAIVDIKAMKLVQGGSTLTQQLAKNLFLSSDKKIIRKIKEVIFAFYIENNYSKEEIILMYLNNVEWGVFQGSLLKGIRAASLSYFEKEPSDLEPFESIILISMLKGPHYYSPLRNFERHKKRAMVVYNRMLKLGLVEEKSFWSDEVWTKWLNRLKLRTKQTYLKSFLQIRSNNYLDAYEQFIFFESVEKMKSLMAKSFEGKDIGIKAIVKELACDSNCQSFYYYSKRERSLQRAIEEEYHQVGSILKPIIYQEILNSGVKLDELVSTEPISLKLLSGTWKPKDSSKVKEPYVTVRKALQKSKNIPLVRLSQKVGFEILEGKLIHLIPRLKTPLEQYPSQLLGAVELSLKEVGELFAHYHKENCFSGEKENTLFTLARATETTVSRLSKNLLSNVFIFGKTGTTNKALDNWYIAIDGKRVIAIWVGLEGSRKGQKLIASGATTAFRVYQNFLEYGGKLINELQCELGN